MSAASLPEPHGRRLRVAMIAPDARPCGVADYTDHLVRALGNHVEVAWVTSPDGFMDAMNAADIVHIQHQYFLFGGVAPWKSVFRRLASRITAPVVLTAHEFVSGDGNAALRAAAGITNRMTFGRRSIRRIIVHTACDRQRMLDSGIGEQRVTVVRHGVPALPALPLRSAARAALGVDGKFVLTVFGFIARKKGHLCAIDALQRLGDNCVMIIAGGKHPDDRTGYVDEVNARIHERDVSGRVRVTGFLAPPDVAAIYAASDLVLAPFTETSGSGSMAMAFGFGKPVMASAIAPHVEINRETPGALALVPAGDPEALADSIDSLQREPRALRMLTEGARRYAQAHTYARAADETAALYRAVLAEATE